MGKPLADVGPRRHDAAPPSVSLLKHLRRVNWEAAMLRTPCIHTHRTLGRCSKPATAAHTHTNRRRPLAAVAAAVAATRTHSPPATQAHPTDQVHVETPRNTGTAAPESFTLRDTPCSHGEDRRAAAVHLSARPLEICTGAACSCTSQRTHVHRACGHSRSRPRYPQIAPPPGHSPVRVGCKRHVSERDPAHPSNRVRLVGSALAAVH